MSDRVRFAFDPKASHLRLHAFASGLASVVAHSPKFAIQDFSGEASYAEGTMGQPSLKITMKAASLALQDEVTEQERREIFRITYDEVLEVKSYPEITYESSQISLSKISENTYGATILGMLRLHGVSNAHNFNAQVVAGEESIRAYGDFTLKQTDYGIRIASVGGGTLKMRDEIKITYFIIAQRAG
jgi:polyisoprenoid-binding protein YceI